jgi:hypothetical protein
MLLSFSATNFRSFHSEQTLALLASKRLASVNGCSHCCEVPGTNEHVLRVASLYGANGAGKSNLVRALRLVSKLVLEGTRLGEPIDYQPFLLNNGSQTEPTLFELQFMVNDTAFRYGICYDAKRVHEEWLSAYVGATEHSLFTRTTSATGEVQVELAEKGRYSDFPKKLKSLADVGARPNQPFLTEVVNLGTRESQGPHLRDVVDWFGASLIIIGPDARFASLAEILASDETFAKFAGRFLRDASTGIADLDVETREMARTSLPTELQKEPAQSSLPVHVLSGPDGEEVFVDWTGGETVKVRRIRALHDRQVGTPVLFPLHEESDGSQRLLNLLPALHYLARHSCVFVIDELERSMHPILARKFVEFFLKAIPNARSQLIFTTHESTLLDQRLMRRDGIWFSEKNQEGATHLYSLADFKIRNDLKLDKGYLQGRFGAIPFLGGIDHLIEEQDAARTLK